MIFLQLSDPRPIRKLHTIWLSLANEIVNAPSWPKTSVLMQESYSQLKTIEREVETWFFGAPLHPRQAEADNDA